MPKKRLKGVSCQIHKGSKYWSAYIDGRLRYFGKGKKGRKAAEAAKAKDIATKFENREIRGGLKTKKVYFNNFSALADWYLDTPGVKQRSRKKSSAAHLKVYFGKMHVSNEGGKITPQDQKRYRQHRKSEGAMDATIDLEIQHLRTMFNEAYKSEMIDANDMPRHYIQLNQHNPRHVVTVTEYKSILKYCDPDFRDLLICAWESGMRQCEIINLVPNQIYLNVQHFSGTLMDYIDLSIKDSKTKQRRYVPVSPVLKQVLRCRMAGLGPEDYVFTRDGWPHNRTSICRKLSAVCKKAKVKYGDRITDKKGNKVGCVFHSFRYAWISRKVAEGWNDELIRLASGHNSLASFRKYVQLDAASVMKLVKKDKTVKNYNKSRVNAL